ncbi:MAG TPA: RNA polymerase sigma factor [Burkholderiaceae bacterium]|nr:RNA polymerase sigma factor [Burkholderiaceae bacterium]
MSNNLLEQQAHTAVNSAAREHSGRLLALLIRDLKDFHLAQDCLQDALESAVVHWSRNGLPNSTQAWLLQTARRKAIDRIRRTRNFERLSEQYALLLELDQSTQENDEPEVIPDERLRLIFICCHPALDQKTRIVLTLRTLCGLTTTEIARAFLDTPDAMAQRLVRARHKIKNAGIPFELPHQDMWAERLGSVLTVIYLVFNEGYSATSGQHTLRSDLCEEAIRLARMMLQLKPDEAEIEGLLALMLLNHARRLGRSTADDAMIPLDQQNRQLWDHAQIKMAIELLVRALNRHQPGVYQLQAAISAIHAEAESHEATRWHEIVLLYDGMHALSANPVYLLNRAVALSYAESPQAALDALTPLANILNNYQPFYAAQADILRRLGLNAEANLAYSHAIALSQNAIERTFLQGRYDAIASSFTQNI